MEILADFHPLVVHFPIAFIILFTLLEVINLYYKNRIIDNLALLTLFLGVLGGLGAVISGNQAMQSFLTNPTSTLIHTTVIEYHELYATITLWYFVIVLTTKAYFKIKKKNQLTLQYLFLIFVFIGLFFLIKTAKSGGILVYDFGIGTNLLK